MEISGAGGLFSTYSICSNAAGIAGKYFFLLFLGQVRLIWIHDIYKVTWKLPKLSGWIHGLSVKLVIDFLKIDI